jgi:3-deoxy-manno-octulosonate cytidylyltransferase (CMP-KDO synthetase)
LDFEVFIPARFGATRLPGKPLLDIGGKTMIQHVYERAAASGARRVTVATDDPRIEQAVQAFGGHACRTSDLPPSGTDRIREALDRLGVADDTAIVNLQGDEPLMDPHLVASVAGLLAETGVDMGTACVAAGKDALEDPDRVKVVCSASGRALYFSRAPVPWPRDGAPGPVQVHLGIYAYRAGFIRRFAEWAPSAAEQQECLEQLRALDHDARIQVLHWRQQVPAGVDTPADLERVRAHLRQDARRNSD